LDRARSPSQRFTNRLTMEEIEAESWEMDDKRSTGGNDDKVGAHSGIGGGMAEAESPTTSMTRMGGSEINLGQHVGSDIHLAPRLGK
jgi:hypothetical protein